MKKAFLMIAALLAAQAPPALAALKVFACEPEWGALAQELGGEDVDVFTATTALQDVHKIQPRPSLIAKYRQAALLVCTGAELEIGWLPALAEKGNNPRLVAGTPGFFEASRHVKMLDVPTTLDRSQGDVHPYGNPHIQTGPQNIAPVAAALAQRLAQVDPAHADAYRRRHEQFAQRWATALERWKASAQPLAGIGVVSLHRTWTYLYEWLGVREIATIEARPGIPPSAAHLETVLSRLKADPARMLVFAAYEDPRAVQWLAQRAQLPTVQLPFSVGGAEDAGDLFALYDVTIARLLGALAGAR